MADVFNTGGTKATQAVIDAASKILMGIRDQETADATTEENHPIVKEAEEINTANVDKELRHDCAKHVVHKEHGEGTCVPGMHTIEETAEGEGVVTHYDVMFGDKIVQNVPVEELEIVSESSHMHSRKKK